MQAVPAGWLAEPDHSHADIAQQPGFADTRSFYKAFRKWTGTIRGIPGG